MVSALYHSLLNKAMALQIRNIRTHCKWK